MRRSPATPGSPAAPTVVATSTLPEQMGSLPGVAELKRIEATGKLLLPETSSPKRLLNSPLNLNSSGSSSLSIVGMDPDSTDDNARTIDFSDFSSDDSDSESTPPLSSADQPEIVSEIDNLKPIRTNSGAAESDPRPKRRMIPIRDPTIKPEIQMPLLGRVRNKRAGGMLLLGGSEKAPEWPWVTSLRRVRVSTSVFQM